MTYDEIIEGQQSILKPEEIALLKKAYSALDLTRMMATAMHEDHKRDVDDIRVDLYALIARHNGGSPPMPRMLQSLQPPSCGT